MNLSVDNENYGYKLSYSSIAEHYVRYIFFFFLFFFSECKIHNYKIIITFVLTLMTKHIKILNNKTTANVYF